MESEVRRAQQQQQQRSSSGNNTVPNDACTQQQQQQQQLQHQQQHGHNPATPFRQQQQQQHQQQTAAATTRTAATTTTAASESRSSTSGRGRQRAEDIITEKVLSPVPHVLCHPTSQPTIISPFICCLVSTAKQIKYEMRIAMEWSQWSRMVSKGLSLLFKFCKLIAEIAMA